MGIGSWFQDRALRRSVRSQAPSPGVLPPSRSDSLYVTPESAMTLSAVYSAVSVINVGVSQMTVDCYKGNRTVSSPLWVREPDVKMSRSAFFAETVNSLALHGNAYWHVIRDSAADAPQALVVLPPNEVNPFEDGTFGYKGKTFERWQISHLKLTRVPGVLLGLGPIQAARQELRGMLEQRDYASSWFDQSGVPNGVLSSDYEINDEMAAALKATWNESATHRNGVAVLPNGLSYSPLNLKPADAQFLETQQWGVTQVARLFGIPAHLMLAAVEGTSNTYVNMADADLTFVRWTLMKYLREIEEAISRLLPRGQTARFNLDAVLRPSTKARYEAHKIAIEAGFLTRDEVRAIEGFDPLEKEESNV